MDFHNKKCIFTHFHNFRQYQHSKNQKLSKNILLRINFDMNMILHIYSKTLYEENFTKKYFCDNENRHFFRLDCNHDLRLCHNNTTSSCFCSKFTFVAWISYTFMFAFFMVFKYTYSCCCKLTFVA